MGHATRLPYRGDDDIGLPGRGHRFGNHLVGGTRVLHHFGVVPVEEIQVLDQLLVVGDVGAAGVNQPSAITEGGLHGLAQRDRLFRHTGSRPAAEHVDM